MIHRQQVLRNHKSLFNYEGKKNSATTISNYLSFLILCIIQFIPSHIKMIFTCVK